MDNMEHNNAENTTENNDIAGIQSNNNNNSTESSFGFASETTDSGSNDMSRTNAGLYNEAQRIPSDSIPAYYTESFKKQKPKRNIGLLHLALVSVISSILGGAIVFSVFQFVAPAVEPSVNSYFSSIFGKDADNNTSVPVDNAGTIKKIEITQSESPVTAIAEKVSPSIVGIRVTATVQDFFFGARQGTGEGSGIIIKEDGYIMTNNHVIEGALASSTSNRIVDGAKIEVFLPDHKDKPYTATIIGRDAKTDLAVIKIDATGLAAAELGDSSDLKVGELAVAIGSPAGLEFMSSVTVGVISGLDREVQIDESTKLTLIQTDAAINQGNSGGALVNSEGKVIGINTAKIVQAGFEGLGFAIPINDAKIITQSLMEYKYVKGRPRLGIYIEQGFTEAIAKQNKVPMGLLVADVEPLSGAYKAGMQRYDIITKFDGQAVKTFNELETIKNKHVPGDIVEVEVYRDGKTLTLKVELNEAQPDTE